MPLESLTRTHFLVAELGFSGFLMIVFRTTAFKWGAKPMGVSFFVFFTFDGVRCLFFKGL
jgi:hypothetical protein